MKRKRETGMVPEMARRMVRRDFLYHCGLGLGSIALASMLSEESSAAPARDPLAPKPPHYVPKARRVVQLFMAGGPSQLELFDYKPKLQQLSGQPVPKSLVEGKRFAFLKPDARLLGTVRKFRRWGECGAEISELLPHIAGMADELAIIKTMHTDNFNHGPAKLLAQTGFQLFGHPSIGAWVLYGLGSESRDLPGYVVLLSGPRGPRGGAYLWSSGFLPTTYQGVPFRSQGAPILNLENPPGFAMPRQRRVVEAVARLNQLHYQAMEDDEIATRTAAYEMAFRMQMSAPALVDLSDEPPYVLRRYGVEPGQPSFAYNCLLARRLLERGVRFVTLFHTDWDHHGGAENLEGALENVCRQVDQPTAALLADLKERGLLEDTVVVWGGEFGRTPMGEQRQTLGRDHHIDAFTVWLAGGGIKGGVTVGETDELGFYPTESSESFHVHDLHATVLHLLGLDHTRLTFRFQGRDFRLTDVGGRLIEAVLA